MNTYNAFEVQSLLNPLVWERITKSLNHEEGDRVPIWDFIDNRDVFLHFADSGDDPATGMVKVYHGLGIDLCRGFGGAFDVSQEGQTTGEGRVDSIILGRTHWWVNKPIKKLDDLKGYAIPPVSEEGLAQWVNGIREQQRRMAPHTMYVPGGGCGFHGTYGLMGLMLFCEAVRDARDKLERLMWEYNRQCVQYARAAAESRLAPIYFIGDDIAYKGTTMFSPQFLRETFIPMLARTAEPARNAGMKVIFHSDGNVMGVLDDMIEAGIDGLNPLEPIAGMDIGFLKKRYGKSLVLVGNVDCSQVLPLGSVKDVVEATRECIRQASPGGGHFIGSSSEIVPATPLENVLAFYRTCREDGRYPILI